MADTTYTTDKIKVLEGATVAVPMPPIVAGATAVLHAGKYAMIFNPDGTLEFPQFETYPDSVKEAAKVLCEHVSVAYKTLAAERDHLLAELRRRDETIGQMNRAADEWSEAFYIALESIKDIRDGVFTPEEAIKKLEESAEHCQKVSAAARGQLKGTGNG